MITVKSVTKIYGKKQNKFTALDDVSLDIPKGSSVAILGKSGSGKSTLMHVMSGLDTPQKGKIIIGKHDILKLKSREIDRFRAREMGFIFQSFFVEGRESCYENVSLTLEMMNTPKSRRKDLILDALEAVDLSDKVHEKAMNLSGGQKQRLAIARAIVGEPKILFADEPTGNLDSATSKIIEDLLFDYQKRNKATLVVVTHDEELASRCDKIVRIRDGKILTDKKPSKKSAVPTRKKRVN